MDKLVAGGEKLSKAKIFIDDTPGQNMLRIAANARRLKLRHDIRLVAIDYLQLIDPDNRRDSRQEQVAAISRRLKFLARELKIPVIALAQVNRSSEDRQDHRPRLSDLRESGAIEQDADTVFLLHRPEYHEPGQHEGMVEVIVGKQRNGPTGEISLMYIKQYMRFENFAVEHSSSYSGNLRRGAATFEKTRAWADFTIPALSEFPLRGYNPFFKTSPREGLHACGHRP